MDEMNGNDNERRMPWPVRIALGWFVLLAVACCVPLVHVQTLWFGDEYQGLFRMAWMHIVCIGFIALGVGFVAAILRGMRDLVAIPYFLVGLLAFFMPITGSQPPSLTIGLRIYLYFVAAGTIIPLVLLYGPSSSRLWFLSFPRQKRLGAGCCTLLVLAIFGLMASMLDVTTPQVMDAARMNATAMRGHNMYVLLVRNEAERATGAQVVEVTSCTNSCELVAELCSCFENDTGLAAHSNDWSFAINVPSDAPDTFPVMITANVDPAELPREWDGETDKDKMLELKPLEGVEPLRFGDRGIVVVRKSGAAQVIRRKFMTLGRIFGDEPFKFGKATYFLTPVGKRKAGCK